MSKSLRTGPNWGVSYSCLLDQSAYKTKPSQPYQPRIDRLTVYYGPQSSFTCCKFAHKWPELKLTNRDVSRQVFDICSLYKGEYTSSSYCKTKNEYFQFYLSRNRLICLLVRSDVLHNNCWEDSSNLMLQDTSCTQ